MRQHFRTIIVLDSRCAFALLLLLAIPSLANADVDAVMSKSAKAQDARDGAQDIHKSGSNFSGGVQTLGAAGYTDADIRNAFAGLVYNGCSSNGGGGNSASYVACGQQ